jgi:uncharacterized protein (DUF58 family)
LSTRPSKLGLALSFALALASLAVFAWPVAGAIALGGTLSLALFMVLDALAARRLPPIRLRREVPPAMALGERYEIELVMEGSRREQLVVFDRPPAEWLTGDMPVTIDLLPDRPTRVRYAVRPHARGTGSFEPAHVIRRLPLRLLEVRQAIGDPEGTRVYPDFRVVASAVAPPGKQVGAGGTHLSRMRGHGLEFHQLRDFREGDALRQIDWKSVARQGRLISREYREEQYQRVVFVLDCGLRMRAKDGEKTHFERTLEALLILAYAATRRGDAVGLVTFGGVDRRIAPARGSVAFRAMLHGVYDLEPTDAPSDFAEAVRRLEASRPRRSLVVLLSDVREEDAAELALLLAPVRKRHLVLVASLLDPAIREAAHVSPDTLDEAVLAASALDYMGRRRRALTSLRRRSVWAVAAEPEGLGRALLDRYVELKRAGLT